MNFCVYCGNQLNNNSKFCSKCGNIINNNNFINYEKKGKEIASMVLGIIAISWSFLEMLSFTNLSEAIELIKFSYYDMSFAKYLGFFIGYNLLSLPCGIIGLILGLNSKIDCGQKKAGIITSIISLFIVIISLLIIIMNI